MAKKSAEKSQGVATALKPEVAAKIVEKFGGPELNGEHERVKTLLHDRNRDLNEIFAARKAIKECKGRINELAAELKEAKEDLKEAESHLQGVIDGQLSGERNLFPPEDQPKKPKTETPKVQEVPPPKTLPAMTERGAETKPPVPDTKPAETETVAPKEEIGEDIAELPGLSEARIDAIRKNGVDRIPELEELIGKGIVQTWKGFGESTMGKVHDAIIEYRKEHPKDTDVPADLKPVQGTLKADLEAAREGINFDEASEGDGGEDDLLIDDEDDSLITGDVDLLDDDESELAPAEAPEVGEESQEPTDDEDEDQDPDHAEVAPAGKPAAADKAELDPGELADILCGIFVYVPGEVISGWKNPIRQAVKQWAVDVSDAADGKEDPPTAYPRQLERFLKKNQIADPVTFVKNRRG